METTHEARLRAPADGAMTSTPAFRRARQLRETTYMNKLLKILLVASLALSMAACGRDDRQEKAGKAASKEDSAMAPSGSASPKEPLQTGEIDPSKAGELPAGTKSGARTTPNPK